jgi:hypothetical protein
MGHQGPTGKTLLCKRIGPFALVADCGAGALACRFGRLLKPDGGGSGPSRPQWVVRLCEALQAAARRSPEQLSLYRSMKLAEAVAIKSWWMSGPELVAARIYSAGVSAAELHGSDVSSIIPIHGHLETLSRPTPTMSGT